MFSHVTLGISDVTRSRGFYDHVLGALDIKCAHSGEEYAAYRSGDDPATLWLAFAFTVVAIIGKIVCGLPAGSSLNRLAIGIGMVPRGEVGLIFASIGKGLGVVDDAVFSALVVVVMGTTLIMPPALTWSLSRNRTG